LALTSIFYVELPGIETDDLPGLLGSQLPVRSVSFRFVPARYLWFRFRVFTASRRHRQVHQLDGDLYLRFRVQGRFSGSTLSKSVIALRPVGGVKEKGPK
jgi:hypothetical protein